MYQPSTTTDEFPSGPLQVIYDSKDRQLVSQGCNEEDFKDVMKGRILLVRRGQCTFGIKSKLASNKGAKGLLVYDDQEQDRENPLFLIQSNDDGTENNKFPIVAIHSIVANKLIHRNDSRPIQVEVEKDLINENLTSALKISSFSSAGPTYDLELKPNIAGIGGKVFSTIPLHQNNTLTGEYNQFPKGWGVKSGTSMASPHISGVLALVLQSYRERTKNKIDSQFIIEHLQNHAKIIMANDSLSVPDHPILQGAGLAQRKYLFIYF